MLLGTNGSSSFSLKKYSSFISRMPVLYLCRLEGSNNRPSAVYPMKYNKTVRR